MTSRNPAAVEALVAQVRSELAAGFVPDRPIHTAYAPGRLDVMGGLTLYTGGLLCQTPIDLGATVGVQARDDRSVQVFSFNLFNQQKPFTLIIPLDALALPLKTLQREFAEPGRTWAAAVVGCLAILHDAQRIDLRNPSLRGLNIAVQSDVPERLGLGSSAAMIAAAMSAMVDAFALESPPVDELARLCQRVAVELAGEAHGAEAFLVPLAGQKGVLTRVLVQPFESHPPLPLPEKIRIIAIDTGVRAAAADLVARKRTRVAAFMGHKLILEKMRQLGAAAGRELIADPMNGYLANLPLADYKRFFRPYLPESLKGGPFLLQHRGTIDPASKIEPDYDYAVQQATDYHVFDANRTREFVRYIEAACAEADAHARTLLLDKAGHLMYASHVAYAKDALLGNDDVDLLIEQLRAKERSGIYGARLTGPGIGGVVAALCDEGPGTDRAIQAIIADYAAGTGRPARVISGIDSPA